VNSELAEEVVLVAAPIYAALLAVEMAAGGPVSTGDRRALMATAILDALELRKMVQESEVSTRTAA
jgi:hypothetical protein